MGARFLHAFLDESYGADHYYMAAVVVDDREYRKLRDGLDRVASAAHEQFNVDPDVEFHAHDIMQGRKSWECFHGRVHEAVALCRTAARAIRESGALLIIEGVDVARLNNRYNYPDPPYDVTLRHTLERVNEYAKRRELLCRVTADFVNDHNQHSAVVEGYMRTGTPGCRTSKLERLVQPVQWSDSGDERGIQAADMLAYIYRRVREPEPSRSRRADRAARTILREFGSLQDRKWLP
jgi:hypothetical protein